MPGHTHTHKAAPLRCGFTLIELLVVVAIVVILVGILLPALAAARRAARTTLCISQMKQFSTATHTYASDSKDLIATFSWSPQLALTVSPDYERVHAEFDAAAAQATQIIREQTGRTLDSAQPFEFVRSWLPYESFNHLVLVDYIDQKLPFSIAACPEDRDLQQWQVDPAEGFFQLPNRPFESASPGPTPVAPAQPVSPMPYSSSYQFVPAAVSNYRDNVNPGQNAGPYDQVVAHHRRYTAQKFTRFGGQRFNDVAHPAQKVLLNDAFDRHHAAKETFFAYEDARQPLLFFDGSISTRRTGDANPGFRPTTPSVDRPRKFYYDPELTWEPPTASGEDRDLVTGYYRWTRNGLAGIDYGGAEPPPPTRSSQSTPR